MSELRAIARGTPGAEWRTIIDVPAPAAGSAVSVSVPGLRAWQLLGVAALLTPSAVAGNRRPRLTLRDAPGIALAAIASPTLITATQTTQVSWTPGQGGAVVVPGTACWLPLPERWYMQAQESLTIDGTTDAADTWTNIRVTVLETYIGDAIHERNAEQLILDHWTALTDLLALGRH